MMLHISTGKHVLVLFPMYSPYHSETVYLSATVLITGNWTLLFFALPEEAQIHAIGAS